MPAFYPAPPITAMVNTADGEQAVVEFFEARGWQAATTDTGDRLLVTAVDIGSERYPRVAYTITALWGWVWPGADDSGQPVIYATGDVEGCPDGYLPVPE